MLSLTFSAIGPLVTEFSAAEALVLVVSRREPPLVAGAVSVMATSTWTDSGEMQSVKEEELFLLRCDVSGTEQRRDIKIGGNWV